MDARRSLFVRPLVWPLVSILLALAGACATDENSGPPPAVTASAIALLPAVEMPAVVPSPVPFVSLEGPLWVAAGPYLLFSDVVEKNAPGAVIYRFDPAYRRFSIFPYPPAELPGPTSTNGLAVDTAGDLVACERYNGRL